MHRPVEEQERKLRAAAVRNTSDRSLPFGFRNVLVRMHCGEAPFGGKGGWSKEEELLSIF